MVSDRIRAGLVALWFVINVLDAVWIYFYVRFATHPYPTTIANTYPRQWIGFYVMMYIFGFFWGCVNIFVWHKYFTTVFLDFIERWNGESSISGAKQWSIAAKITSPGAFLVYWYLVHALVIIPVAIIMCLGPFFSPWPGLKISQHHAWSHTCDSFPVEVILTGLRYDSPQTEVPRASFYFKNGSTLYYEYGLSAAGTIWHFTLCPVNRSVSIPAQVYPSVQSITYDLTTYTILANCTSPGTSTNTTTPCVEGSFEVNTFLKKITTNDTRSNTVVTLQTDDKGWSLDRSVDAPNFKLYDVRDINLKRKDVIIKTVVTKPSGCNCLKLCLARESGVEMVVPIGLALHPQDVYARACTQPSSG